MNRERVNEIKSLLVSEKMQAANDRDLFLVRQLGTIVQNLEALLRRDDQKNLQLPG